MPVKSVQELNSVTYSATAALKALLRNSTVGQTLTRSYYLRENGQKLKLSHSSMKNAALTSGKKYTIVLRSGPNFLSVCELVFYLPARAAAVQKGRWVQRCSVEGKHLNSWYIHHEQPSGFPVILVGGHPTNTRRSTQPSNLQ